jgi:hypothetical protein
MTVTALVYRPSIGGSFDSNGDPLDADGNVTRPESPHSFLGTLEVLISQSQPELIAPRLTGSGGGSVDRAEVSDVATVIGAPIAAAVLLQHGDRLLIEDSGYGGYYQVFGPRRFDTPNSLCPNWGHRLYFVSAVSTDG